MEHKNDLEQFCDTVYKLFTKYNSFLNETSFDTFFEESIKVYNKYKNIIPDINTNFVSSLYRNTIKLNRYKYNKYIKCMKKYKIYKYKKDFIPRLLFRFFPKTYLFIYFYRRNIIEFFITKYKFFKSYNEKKLLYSVNQTGSLKYFLSNKVYLDYLELVITTKCTLRCKHCSNLMYMYKNPYHCNKNLIEKSLDELFKAVDRIEIFRILGGEPFCNNDLYSYLKMLHYDRIGEVHIVTNGTMVPKDKKLIDIIKKNNIVIDISNYGKYSYNLNDLIKLLDSMKIKYELQDFDNWYDYGKLIDYGKSKKDLKKQFSDCDIRCKSLLNGKLYYCPRAGHGNDLNVISEIKGEYVDIINNDYKTNKKGIKKLYKRRKYIEACKYCKYATTDCKKIKPAEQLRKEV